MCVQIWLLVWLGLSHFTASMLEEAVLVLMAGILLCLILYYSIVATQLVLSPHTCWWVLSGTGLWPTVVFRMLACLHLRMKGRTVMTRRARRESNTTDTAMRMELLVAIVSLPVLFAGDVSILIGGVVVVIPGGGVAVVIPGGSVTVVIPGVSGRGMVVMM